MKYTLHENLHETSGAISNLHGFLHRYNDTGFKTKWTGFWVPPYKFLDYYSIKINGVWLGPETLDATEYGEKFVHHHSLDTLNVREVVETPENLPGMRINIEVENLTDEPKAVHTALEPGVDIREKSQDLGPTDYKMDRGAQRMTVSAEDKSLMFASEKEFEIEGNSYVKEHEPGERQRCFVPGQIAFRKKVEGGKTDKIELEVTTSDASFGSLDKNEQGLHNQELGRTFENSVESLENLIYDRKGKGIIAGHPWFQSYWARDSFWSLLGLIDAGRFKLSREILENYVEHDINGKISLNGSEEDFPRSDTLPLFVIASKRLESFTGNNTFKEEREKVFDQLELKEGVVQHDPMGTWMDTLERENAVDIQSLWLEAAKLTGHESEEKLRDGLEKFMTDGYMKDHLGEDSPRTINPAVPLMFGQVDSRRAEKYLSVINGEFNSMYGARTRSMTDPGYSSDGYHEGSVWGLTTGWAAAANFRYGKTKQGLNMLKKMTQYLDRNQLGALPEVVDAESGENLGALEQAWSAGMFVHVVDSYLLGINPKEDDLDIKPSHISCERLSKKFREHEMDLKIEDGEVTEKTVLK